MIRTLIAGRSTDYVLQLQNRVVELGDYKVTTNILMNGLTDPLQNVEPKPDILVLVVADNQIAELETLARQSPVERVPLIVIGDALEPVTMRLAMQAGARDFLSADADEDQLADTLRLLAAENAEHARHAGSHIVSVLNAAGGDGASTIAVNLAAGLAAEQQEPVASIDLNLQFSSLAKYFDAPVTRSLLEAFERIDELDSVALSGYYATTPAGVDLASVTSEPEVHNRDALDESFSMFLDRSTAKYGWIVLDVPHQLDALGVAALESSETIVLVMQQNLKSIHQATCLLEIMRQHLGIPPERISIVVNRYHKSATLELKDIKRVVKAEPLFTVPNEFSLVSQSNELGKPLYADDSRSGPAMAIREILASLGAVATPVTGNFLTRRIASLLRN